MKNYKMPRSCCPTCGYSVDTASNATGSGKPRPKDFTICLNCGDLLRFAEDLTMIATGVDQTSDELTPKQKQMIAHSQHFIRQRGPIR